MAWLGGSHVAVVTKLAEGFSPGVNGQGPLDILPPVCLPTRGDGRDTPVPLRLHALFPFFSWPRPAIVGQHTCPTSSQVTPLSPGLL